MSLDQLLYRLRTDHTLASNITRWETIPPRPARYAPLPATLHPRLSAAQQKELRALRRILAKKSS